MHGHHIVVGVHPAHFRVHTGELSRVTGSEGGVSPERRGDLEHCTETCGLSHLFEELGALREVGGGIEIADLEKFCARFAGARHELRCVDFNPVVVHPPGAQSVLKRCLGTEDEVC